jgi:hypothetical protein
LYKTILGLFCHIDIIFPNFIGGIITREHVREALSKGITANQIALFLNKHAHDQMYIKKDMEEEKDDPSGILVNSREHGKVKLELICCALSIHSLTFTFRQTA